MDIIGLKLHAIPRAFYTQMTTDQGVSAFPEGDNMFKWVGTIRGPVGTVSVANGGNMASHIIIV